MTGPESINQHRDNSETAAALRDAFEAMGHETKQALHAAFQTLEASIAHGDTKAALAEIADLRKAAEAAEMKEAA